jgi:hypothetical protein
MDRTSRKKAANQLGFPFEAEHKAAEQQGFWSREELHQHLSEAAFVLARKGHEGYSSLAADLYVMAHQVATSTVNLMDLERRLAVIENKMAAIARSLVPLDQLLAIRNQFDQELRPYQSKITAPMMDRLEPRYLHARLLEEEQLPRLSLFSLHYDRCHASQKKPPGSSSLLLARKAASE